MEPQLTWRVLNESFRGRSPPKMPPDALDNLLGNRWLQNQVQGWTLRVRLPEPGSNCIQASPGQSYGFALAGFGHPGRLSGNNTRLLEPACAGSRCASGVFRRRAGAFPGVPEGHLDRRRFLDRHNPLPEKTIRPTRQPAYGMIQAGAGTAHRCLGPWEEAGSRTMVPDWLGFPVS